VSDLELLGRLAPGPERGGRVYGVVVGVVTNNRDPDGLGRVKLKFPWLSDEDESRWARVVTPMAGPERGLYFLPEVDDEVLVVFEHGLVDHPFVLGALWNGRDKPPARDDDNNLRLIKSRSGHTITLDDEDGKGKIAIVDRTGNNRVVIDSADNTVTVTSDGDLTLKARGAIALEAEGDVTIKGRSLAADARQSFELKAAQGGKIEAQSGLSIDCLSGVNVNKGALEVT
jgi:phage baseplate assembly protein V